MMKNGLGTITEKPEEEPIESPQLRQDIKIVDQSSTQNWKLL